MLGKEGLDFSNTDLIFHLNSIPRVYGSFRTTDSTAHAMSRLKCGFIIKKFNPFKMTAPLVSVRMCLEKLRINFLEAEVAVDY
jgi:hypothetical protein